MPFYATTHGSPRGMLVTSDPVLPGSPRLVVEVVMRTELAASAAGFIAMQAQRALAERDRFVLAVSGGTTPGPMLETLFARDLDWDRVVLLQTDERVAPDGHADRNLTQLQDRLAGTPAEAADLRAMPVLTPDLDAAAADYAEVLHEVAGRPPVIDVVHLGLGHDGHTASLVPGDAVLDITDADVGVTGTYQGHRRLTLTYPALNRARVRVYLVSGEEKCAAVRGLLTQDPDLPATRVRRDAHVFADADCMG